jgi:hypothetical protein
VLVLCTCLCVCACVCLDGGTYWPCFFLWDCSNAGKFTTSGCVRVTVSLVGARSPRKSILPRQSTQLASPVATRERRSWFKRVMTRRRRRQIADSAVATSTATSPLTVDVEAAPDSHTFVCVTISNTRAGAPIPDPEDCFIPFRQAGGGLLCVAIPCSITVVSMVAV